MTDIEAIKACLSGDRNSFRYIVERYKFRAFNSALMFTGNREDALDLSQEAFARAYRALERFDLNRSFFTWCYQILKNLCINHLQSKRRRRHVSLDDADHHYLQPTVHGSESPDEMMEKSEQNALLWEAINQLDDDDREIILMKEFQDFSYKEISEALHIPIGTVMSRLYYARKKLVKRLGRLDD
jgi:RNA polymerase sigma-70 factor (ECF subfamily)